VFLLQRRSGGFAIPIYVQVTVCKLTNTHVCTNTKRKHLDGKHTHTNARTGKAPAIGSMPPAVNTAAQQLLFTLNSQRRGGSQVPVPSSAKTSGGKPESTGGKMDGELDDALKAVSELSEQDKETLTESATFVAQALWNM
jgi:hypothetical protein